MQFAAAPGSFHTTPAFPSVQGGQSRSSKCAGRGDRAGTMTGHILASITAHGFGHMAITAPVLERVHALAPQCRVTVSSDIAEPVLRRRIACPFELVADPDDFGLRMHRDLSVDVPATVADYDAVHGDWAGHVEGRAARLADAGYDLVLANISYMNIAAAARAGIPAIALCPLNWADLYHHFAPDSPACEAVFAEMAAAYNQAGVFLAPRPCMPMPNFHNVEVIPPIAQVGDDRRGWIREVFGLDASTRLVLLALGGQEAGYALQELPVISNTCWIVDERWGLERADILPLGRTGLAFPDLLASSDLLVGKPGYGAFAEAACLGKPVVYMRRPAWPEEAYLIEWLARQVPCREVTPGDTRALEAAARELAGAPPLRHCSPDGIDVAARRILAGL